MWRERLELPSTWYCVTRRVTLHVIQACKCAGPGDGSRQEPPLGLLFTHSHHISGPSLHFLACHRGWDAARPLGRRWPPLQTSCLSGPGARSVEGSLSGKCSPPHRANPAAIDRPLVAKEGKGRQPRPAKRCPMEGVHCRREWCHEESGRGADWGRSGPTGADWTGRG